jgi:hypothetical protein
MGSELDTTTGSSSDPTVGTPQDPVRESAFEHAATEVITAAIQSQEVPSTGS